MGQERLSNLAILPLENGEVNFEDVNDEFATVKLRKVQL